MSTKLLVPGETCWAMEPASQIKLLMEASNYYECLRRVCLQAKNAIYILGWDIDSRTPLRGLDSPTDGFPEALLPFLSALLERTPALKIFILSWDFSLLYVWERQFLPRQQFVWQGKERLAFQLDGQHPAGASHHQKIVVVDDGVAFSGGIDLTLCRWDTCEHLPNDKRRMTPDGHPYGTMHDAQIGVAGPAATKLGDLFRERWLRATSQTIEPPQRNPIELPESDLNDHEVGLSRTIAEWNGAAIQEVEALTIKAIASAQRHIMIENQYLSSAIVGEALAERLRAEGGPEILVILPRAESGWLEQESMGLLKQRLLKKLREADKEGRLRVLHPSIEGPKGSCDVYVHSKIVFVDDRFVKVGSSNLSNRSMRLDTECDVSIEAQSGSGAGDVIKSWRLQLLGEHLGRTSEEVSASVERHGGMNAAVDELAKTHAGRTLKPVPEKSDEDPSIDLSVYGGLISDPEKPLSSEALLGEAMPERLRKRVRITLLVYAAGALAVLSLLAWLKFVKGIDIVALTSRWLGNAAGFHAQSFWGMAFIALVVFVASCLFFPLSITMTVVCLVAPGWRAFVTLYFSALASALAMYWVGRSAHGLLPDWVWRKTLILQRKLKYGGFLAVLVARLVPVGSFTLINGAAGTLKIPFAAYAMANVVGLFPGIFLMSFLSGRLAAFWHRTSAANAALSIVAAVSLLGGLAFIGYLVRKQVAIVKANRHNQRSGAFRR